GHTPFKYLGLPVGANPRKFATWEPMVNAIRGKLSAWGNKHVTLGGRIVMINAVLNAIPIFYLSLLKMPVKVWKEIVKIQRTFLWGGLSKRNRICWVKWDDFCKPKSEAGLGIRDLRLVNLSLLAKWRWKLLSPDMEVWKDVVVAKYGQEIIGKGNLGDLSIPRLASKWWSGICNLDKDTNWFSEAVEKRVGDGILTYFWNDVWMGNQALRHRFPRIYAEIQCA
ncbi:RNA-directed DNA polymerase (Reverse transcriptase), partial [Trifolium medium]|nr:RNA-directed DNA polymerase (Reverse transcriptase) [Trifolium medium]